MPQPLDYAGPRTTRPPISRVALAAFYASLGVFPCCLAIAFVPASVSGFVAHVLGIGNDGEMALRLGLPPAVAFALSLWATTRVLRRRQVLRGLDYAIMGLLLRGLALLLAVLFSAADWS